MVQKIEQMDHAKLTNSWFEQSEGKSIYVYRPAFTVKSLI